jgi:hypothetical protein
MVNFSRVVIFQNNKLVLSALNLEISPPNKLTI